MAAQNIVQLGFNVEELTAEKKQVLDLFVDLFGKLKEYDGTRFNPLGNGGLSDLKKSLTDGAAAMSAFGETAQKYNAFITEQFQKQQNSKKSTDDLTLATQAYKKIVDEISNVQAKANAGSSNAAENLAIEKEQLRQRNTELQAGVKFLLAETGSVAEARAATTQLKQERDKLNASDAEGAARIAELNAKIDENNRFINANTSGIERQKNNVGNYIGAIGILESSLASIGGELNAMAAAGNVSSESFAKLTLEQKILQAQLDRQKEGFATVTAEMRSTKNTLDALKIAGLETGEAFEKLNIAYTRGEQSVKDLHREQAILTSDAPGLTALTGVAKGLGGAYALGAGASALFANGNEKLEKELNKLVAVMTFLQGLQEATNALRERNAIGAALQAEAEKALTFVRKIEIALFGETAAASAIDTAAKQANTDAAIINTEALEANAVGAEAQAVAVEGVAAAEGVATAATISFRTALISTGIGAIIIGLIYGITKLVGAISDWASADERAEKTQAELAKGSLELLETFKQLQEAYAEGGKERVDQLLKQANLEKDAGKNVFIQLDNEKKINEQRRANAKKFLDQQKIDEKTVENLYQTQVFALQDVYNWEGSLKIAREAANKDNTSHNRSIVEETEKQLALSKDLAKFEVDRYKVAKDALKEFTDAQHEATEIQTKTKKEADDLQDKLTASAAQRRFDVQKDANDRILGLDTSTEAQRLSAIKGNYKAEAQLAGAQILAITKNIEDQSITEKEGADQIANIQTALGIKRKKQIEDELKTRIDYNDRLLAAQNQVGKNGNEGDAAVQDAITKDTQQQLQARLDALTHYTADKAAIIADDFTLQLKLAKEHGKTQQEQDAIESDRDKALVELTADSQKKIYDIVISYGDRKLKAIQDQNKAADSANSVNNNYNEQVDKLNTALNTQTISYTRYINERRRLDRTYAIQKDAADVADDQLALKRIKDYEDADLASKKRLADANLIRAKENGSEDDVKNAQSEVDAIADIQEKARVEEKAANDKLNKDKQKQNDDAVKLNLAAAKFLHDQEQQIADSSLNLAQTMVDAGYEKRINQIQKVIDKQDQASEEEIAAVQRSTLSARDQAAEVIILQAQQKARDTQLKREQVQEKIKEAKFDRDVAVAKVIWSTSQAEIAAIGEYAGTPYAFAIAAVIAALGAVQVATILAKPIPTYSEGIGIPGKGQHPGGLAWVGEAYKPEQVSIPGRDPFIVDKPSLLDLPSGASVLPLDNVVMDLGGIAMSRGMAAVNSRSDNGSAQVVGAINQQTIQMKKAFLKGQRRIINKIEINIDTGWERYLDQKVRGKA